MADQARFYEVHGLAPLELGNALADWFRAQEFEWRTFGDPSGHYTLQIRKASTTRSIFGLNYALTVSFTPQGDGKLLVELGGADWTDKIVSGAVGALLITPLLFTAAYGAWQQSELANKVWEFLQGYVYQRTGQPANFQIALPYYVGTPGYQPNVPPPAGSYNPTTNYAPTMSTGFPPVGSQPAPTTPSWFSQTTMQPIFDQQIGKMMSWQRAMEDGKVTDEEIKEQAAQVEKLRQSVEQDLDTSQRIKFAEVIAAMENLEAVHKS